MKVWIFIFTAVFGSSVVSSSDFQPLPVPAGGCDSFCHSNLTKITTPPEGLWYISYAFPNFYSTDAKCITFNFTKINETASSYQFSAIQLSDNTKRLTEGVINLNGSVHLSITEVGIKFVSRSITRTPNYIVTYYCFDCGFFSKEGSGIFPLVLTKLPEPSCEHLDKIQDAFDHCDIPLESLPKIDNVNCFEPC